MRILHCLGDLSKSGAGVYVYVKGLAEAERAAGHEVAVAGISREGKEALATDWADCPVLPLPFHRGGPLAPVPGLEEAVRDFAPEFIHCHGLWGWQGRLIPPLARRMGLAYAVSPHGMLADWAWNFKRWKKRPVWALWEGAYIRGAAFLHATSDVEAADCHRRSGGKIPVAMVPTGVALPPLPPKPPASESLRTALFLSRIHPVKGLPNLVEAWRRIRPADWKLVIAGPDEAGHRSEVEAAVRQAGLTDRVHFAGAIPGGERWKVYRSAELFILPTHTENFGLVVAEALGCGVPVVTTKGAPWADLTTHRCGWWVEDGADPLEIALREAFAASPSTLSEMGERGRRLILEEYSSLRRSAELASACLWASGRGERPACVRMP